MLFKRNKPNNQYSNKSLYDDLRYSNPDLTNPYTNNMGMYNQMPNNMYNQMEENRLLYEIKENRRRINNLAKRIIRLENYLRIRDTSDYSILDDETNQ